MEIFYYLSLLSSSPPPPQFAHCYPRINPTDKQPSTSSYAQTQSIVCCCPEEWTGDVACSLAGCIPICGRKRCCWFLASCPRGGWVPVARSSVVEWTIVHLLYCPCQGNQPTIEESPGQWWVTWPQKRGSRSDRGRCTDGTRWNTGSDTGTYANSRPTDRWGGQTDAILGFLLWARTRIHFPRGRKVEGFGRMWKERRPRWTDGTTPPLLLVIYVLKFIHLPILFDRIPHSPIIQLVIDWQYIGERMPLGPALEERRKF